MGGGGVIRWLGLGHGSVFFVFLPDLFFFATQQFLFCCCFLAFFGVFAAQGGAKSPFWWVLKGVGGGGGDWVVGAWLGGCHGSVFFVRFA